MRHRLAPAVIGLSLSGCSLIYNPSDLQVVHDAAPDARPIDASPDAMIDAPPVDADPDALGVDMTVVSDDLEEGQGTGGSPAGLVFVTGHDIDGTAQLEIRRMDNNDVIPTSNVTVAMDHNSLTAQVIAPILTGTDFDGEQIPLLVTVSQTGGGGSMPTMTAMWNLRTYPELLAAPGNVLTSDDIQARYSRVELPAGVTFKGTGAILLRAVADVKITGALQASASAVYDGAKPVTEPGPGGCAGGAASGRGLCGAAGAGAPTTTAASGAGAGLEVAGIPGSAGAMGGAAQGDPYVGEYGTTTSGNIASGGGGGANGSLSAGTGGAGGGGGGTLEITAGGDVNLGTVTAKGSPGGVGAAAALNSAGSGGGGAGGIVILRAGGTITSGAVDVTGGAGGAAATNVVAGGKGSVGRFRFDSAMGTVAKAGETVLRRGPMIVPSVRISKANPTPELTVHSGDGSEFYFTVKPFGENVVSSLPTTFHVSGDTIKITPTLAIGYNEVCVVLVGAPSGTVEGKNCLGIVHLP